MNHLPDWVLIVAIKSGVLIFVVVTCFAYLMLLERKMLGWFQMRVGPTWCGPWGLMQPAADAVKLVLKEDLTPGQADWFVYKVAPALAVLTALLAYAVIPFGWLPDGRPIAIASPNVGILYLLAVASVGVYGIALGGWSSQSKWPLLGAVRSTAQMISYELAMGLSIVPVVMLAGTTDLGGIVAAQSAHHLWYAIPLFIPYFIYGITALAETNRAPFDLPEAETELVAGFHTEYSSLRFGTFFVAEYVNMITVCAIRTLLFLGGGDGPFVRQFPLLSVVWFLAKVGILLFMMIWWRATLPRLRYDRLMAFGWKVLLPTAVGNLLIVAGVVSALGTR
ncbi:MAG: NADH-quinone oxidoreductase subunit NuoH [Candidatus Eremiobacter antarcticus]|nr:NADH-quinone oxidoreductase subunit NuoH [Candidatus Eremiobacteraeota bacterium]MBC5807037.1 NADH-quinone oxidoreductase subunit NuoH [Candidatus Eremiobacteraeota bacterium]PZR62832.1 MAG: NADH-quinone oxidoreductase subunit NuoH [Candidatus Eremiobacter sp. RRmetagenome_bin22]